MTWAACLSLLFGAIALACLVYGIGYHAGYNDHAKQTRVTAPTGADYRNVIALRNYHTLRGKRWTA